MKEPTFNGRELLPLSVMEAAHAGDAMAMEQVLRYYEDYIMSTEQKKGHVISRNSAVSAV